jgi:prophage regulatory protein
LGGIGNKYWTGCFPSLTLSKAIGIEDNLVPPLLHGGSMTSTKSTAVDLPDTNPGVQFPVRLPLASSARKPPQRAVEIEPAGSPDEVIFLRLPKVKAITGLSKSSLYELIRANSFPAPVRLGPRIVALVTSEVKQWAAERISISRSATPDPSSRRMPQRARGTGWAS